MGTVLWEISGLIVRFTLRLIKASYFLLRALIRFVWHHFGPSRKTFGSAQWASFKDLKKAGALSGDGLIVGKSGTAFIRDNNPEGSVLVFAPQGSGKGVGLVIPNLLAYQGTVICTDIKGENPAITARHREQYGPVYRLDLENPQSSHCFNPMSVIRMGTSHEADDAEMLADLMLPNDPKEEKHWRSKSRSWLTAFILYVANKYWNSPELITLAQVNRVVSGPRELLEICLEEMSQMGCSCVAETAYQILNGEGSEETRNIFSNLVKGTEAWSDGRALARVTGKSDFDLESFYGQTQTLYLTVPEEKLTAYAPFLRVMTGLALNGIMRAGKVQAPPKHRPLLLLDETAALGYLEPLEKGMGYLRAYARAMLIFQDLDQLENTYGKARSMISNSGTQIAFGVNDYETAELLSKRIGKKTISTRSVGQSQASDALIKHHDQEGQGEAGRWLIDPAEIMKMHKDESLIFMRGKIKHPIKAQRIKYYQEPAFVGLYDDWRGNVISFPAGVEETEAEAA